MGAAGLIARSRRGCARGRFVRSHRRVCWAFPKHEFTPRVRDAIMNLMSEMDSLRRDLQQTRARLEEVERAADQDQLLPLLNRRAFVRELSRHIGFAARYGTPASLVYFDLDDFKTINDTYSHAAGDAVLAHFAETLHVACARHRRGRRDLGGDEFGVILSHTSEQTAHKKAIEPRRDAARPAPHDGTAAPIAVGFSYGAFELEAGRQTPTVRHGARRRGDVREQARYAMMSGNSASSIRAIWSFNCSLRFFSRESWIWSCAPLATSRRDCGVQIAVLLHQLGEPGAQRLFFGFGHRSFADSRGPWRGLRPSAAPPANHTPEDRARGRPSGRR